MTTIDLRIKISFNIKRIIQTKWAGVISTFTIIQIPVTYKSVIPDDRDFLFVPECQQNLGKRENIFAHVVDANMIYIQIYSVSSITVHYFNKTLFGSFVEYDQNGIYFVDFSHVFLVTGNVKFWIFRTAKFVIIIITVYAMTFRITLSIFITGPAKSVMERNFLTVYDLVVPNGVIIYGNLTVQKFLFNEIQIFFDNVHPIKMRCFFLKEFEKKFHDFFFLMKRR